MRRSIRSPLCSTLLLVTVVGYACPAAARAAERPAAVADTVATLVERWAQAVGGWRHLGGARVAHVRAQHSEGGVAGTSEAWVGRGGYRVVVIEGADRREEVRAGGRAWVKDWNGQVLALDGRDRADLVGTAWLTSLLYAGFTLDSLRAAQPRYAGRDSTGAFEVLTLRPPGGGALELDLDAQTGRPAKAVRRPYDDAITLTFDDWREVQGIVVPFSVSESTGDGAAATTRHVDTVEPDVTLPPPGFAIPRDGPSDVRFAHGREALGIPFDFENDHIMVHCSVNGSPPIWFMFDTGAEITVINQARLHELGLESYGASAISGGGGSTGYAFTRVPKLQVGGVELLDQRDGVIDLSGLERIYGMPMGGILGYDFASRLVITVDYSSRTLDLIAPDARGARPRGTRLPFVLEQGHPHVRAEITVPGGPPIEGDFVIDSGAAESANLTAPFVATHHLLERARTRPAGAPRTLPGAEHQFFAQTTVRGKLSALAFGGFTLTDIPVNLQQGKTGAYASASFAGTIGERILQRFTTTYDYPRRELGLEPGPGFGAPFPPRTTFGATLMSDGADYTTFKVTGVRKDSPAAAAGLQAGDVLAAIDDKPASAWRLAGVRAALSAEGSTHVLDVVRGGEKVRVPLTVHLVSIEDD